MELKAWVGTARTLVFLPPATFSWAFDQQELFENL